MPLLLQKSAMGFLMTTNGQDIDFTFQLKNGTSKDTLSLLFLKITWGDYIRVDLEELIARIEIPLWDTRYFTGFKLDSFSALLECSTINKLPLDKIWGLNFEFSFAMTNLMDFVEGFPSLYHMLLAYLLFYNCFIGPVKIKMVENNFIF